MLNDYLSQAEQVAGNLPGILERRGLPPVIERFLLAQSPRGAVWLFAVLDTQRVERQERYTAAATIHQISTALGGLPVQLSNHSGLRYAVLLSRAPSLPASIDFPGQRMALLQLGVDWRGQPIALRWDDVPHVLVGGMTRSGKSNFLRLLTAQAAAEGHRLILCDPDGRTFPQFAGHPGLLTPIAANPDACELAVDRALGEMIRRAALYAQAGAGIDKLSLYNASRADLLPHVLVVIDEYNGLAVERGGPRAHFADQVNRLAWGGLKFGIHLVVAGQDFTKAIIGPMRDQLGLRVCFRVSKPSASRVVLDRGGAERITTPGRALTNDWGLIQAYAAPAIDAPAGDGLTAEERQIVERVNGEFDGRLTFEALVSLGMSRREAERLRSDWELRGLAVRGGADNAMFLAPKLREPASLQTVQTVQTGPENDAQDVQTEPEGVQTGVQTVQTGLEGVQTGVQTVQTGVQTVQTGLHAGEADPYYVDVPK